MLHTELEVWKLSMILAKRCYRLTDTFPSIEKYGLASQIRRCSSSIPSNISEGAGRGSTKDYLRFINIAMGSLNELETHILLAKDLELLPEKDSIIEDLKPLRWKLLAMRTTLKKKVEEGKK